MKYASLILLIVLFFSCNPGKNEAPSDLKSANLKGKVQQIDKRIHYAVAKVACPAAEKNECSQSSYLYNEKGNLVESSEIDDNGNIAVVSKYIYNRRGICTEIDSYSGEKMTGKEVSMLEGTKLTGVKIYNAGNNLETSAQYLYSGDEVSEVKTLNGNGSVISSMVNEYYGGQLVSQTEKDGTGNVIAVKKFRLNTNNNMTECIITVPIGSGEFKFLFEYEYDKEGNWIKRTQLYNGNIINIVMRNITYFNS